MEETVRDRLYKFIQYLNMSVRQFEIKWGVASGYVRNISKGIGNEHLTNLCKQYPILDLNWLYTGSGSMLKNISENSGNLLKQIENDDRNNRSIETIIMEFVKKTVMDQIPEIIKAVGEAMRAARLDENKNIQLYLENQKEISSMQMEVFRDIVKILSKSEPKDAKEIEEKLFKINTKIA